jgi:hypothetical protein
MSIGDLVSRLTPSFGAEIGVVIFTALFAVLAARLWTRRAALAHAEASTLPLADDDAPKGGAR